MQNKPRISKWIGRAYILLAVLIACLAIALAIWTNVLSLLSSGIVFTTVMVLVVGVLLVTAYSFYKTTYVVDGGFLYSWSPFAVINLRLKDIKEVEQTRVPFYFRGWGAGAYSGRFYIPAVGWTKVIITNLTDGVLITDKKGKHYLITPSNPKTFAKMI
jgi:hypothetical protein